MRRLVRAVEAVVWVSYGVTLDVRDALKSVWGWLQGRSL